MPHINLAFLRGLAAQLLCWVLSASGSEADYAFRAVETVYSSQVTMLADLAA